MISAARIGGNDEQSQDKFESATLVENNLVKVFRVGWLLLYQDVSLFSAKALTAILPGIVVRDSWLKKQIEATMVALNAGVIKGTPWAARESLGVLQGVLAQPTVHALSQLLSEYPSLARRVLNRKVHAGRR